MSETAEKTKKGFYAVQFSFKDCLRRLAYKISSQKLVGFIFASIAIFIICWFAAHAGVFTAELAGIAVRAIRDVAIALLAMRAGEESVRRIVEAKNGRTTETNPEAEKGE